MSGRSSLLQPEPGHYAALMRNARPDEPERPVQQRDDLLRVRRTRGLRARFRLLRNQRWHAVGADVPSPFGRSAMPGVMQVICHGDSDCGPGQTCPQDTGRCTAGGGGGPGVTCGNATCVPGTYCCGSSDAPACGSGATQSDPCYQAMHTTQGFVGLFAECDGAEDCDAGQLCCYGLGSTTEGGHCWDGPALIPAAGCKSATARRTARPARHARSPRQSSGRSANSSGVPVLRRTPCGRSASRRRCRTTGTPCRCRRSVRRDRSHGGGRFPERFRPRSRATRTGRWLPQLRERSRAERRASATSIAREVESLSCPY